MIGEIPQQILPTCYGEFLVGECGGIDIGSEGSHFYIPVTSSMLLSAVRTPPWYAAVEPVGIIPPETLQCRRGRQPEAALS